MCAVRAKRATLENLEINKGELYFIPPEARLTVVPEGFTIVTAVEKFPLLFTPQNSRVALKDGILFIPTKTTQKGKA